MNISIETKSSERHAVSASDDTMCVCPKMSLSQDTESSSEAEAADTDSKAFHELRQQMSSVR